MSVSAHARVCGVTVLLLALGACRGQPGKEPPIVPIRNMHDQPRYKPQAYSAFFEDGRTMRPIEGGTMAREMDPDLEVSTGMDSKKRWILKVPAQLPHRNGGNGAFLRRGEERFGIYCAPCHGYAGDGHGMVSHRAAKIGAAGLQAPTLHTDRLRHIPDGQLFATISNGIRNMPGYKHSLAVDDRWAVASYVRALQLSQAEAEPTTPSESPALPAGDNQP